MYPAAADNGSTDLPPSEGPSTHVRFASTTLDSEDITRYLVHIGDVRPEEAAIIVVFRGLRIGIYRDW